MLSKSLTDTTIFICWQNLINVKKLLNVTLHASVAFFHPKRYTFCIFLSFIKSSFFPPYYVTKVFICSKSESRLLQTLHQPFSSLKALRRNHITLLLHHVITESEGLINPLESHLNSHFIKLYTCTTNLQTLKNVELKIKCYNESYVFI